MRTYRDNRVKGHFYRKRYLNLYRHKKKVGCRAIIIPYKRMGYDYNGRFASAWNIVLQGSPVW